MELIEIENLYRKYGPMVLRRCRFLLKDEDKASDAMQDVFVQLLSNLKNLTVEYPSSLLYRIATNICLNKIKSDKSHSVHSDDNLLSSIAKIDTFETKVIINDLLNIIFKREAVSTKEIAVMHYIDGMTLEAVAAESGLSVSGVRKRLRNLRKKAVLFNEGRIF